MIFKDKVAVVTGAGGTLCSAISIELAKQYAKDVLDKGLSDKVFG